MVNLPEYSVPLVRPDQGMSKPWYQALASLFSSANGLLDNTAAAGTMPGNYTGAAAPDVRQSKSAVKTWLDYAASEITGLAPVATAGTYDSLTGTWTLVDAICGVIEVPTNKTYIIALNMPFPFTVNSMTTLASGGTCTLVTTKNGTAIGGLSNPVSTSQVLRNASSGNVFAIGDGVRLVISANASCTDVSFTLKITRTLP
jgi:hypothetical protein